MLIDYFDVNNLAVTGSKLEVSGIESVLNNLPIYMLKHLMVRNEVSYWPMSHRNVLVNVVMKKEESRLARLREHPALPLSDVLKKANTTVKGVLSTCGMNKELETGGMSLIASLNRSTSHDGMVSLETLLDICGLRFTLYIIRDIFIEKEHQRGLRLFACVCARKVLPVIEKSFPKFRHPHQTIEKVEGYLDGTVTLNEAVAQKEMLFTVYWNELRERFDSYVRNAFYAACRTASYLNKGLDSRIPYLTVGTALNANPNIYFEFFEEFRLFCRSQGKYARQY